MRISSHLPPDPLLFNLKPSVISLYIYSSNFCSLVDPCYKYSKLNQMLKSYILQKYNNPSNIGIFISFFHNCISQGNFLHIHKCLHFLTSQSLPHCYQSDVHSPQSKDAAFPRNNSTLCVENFEKNILILTFHAQCLFLPEHSLPLEESIQPLHNNPSTSVVIPS